MPLKNAYTELVSAPVILKVCPRCGEEPFQPFMRGQVHRDMFRALAERFLARTQKRSAQCWTLICRRCKEIVAYEDDAGNSVSSERLNEKDAEARRLGHKPQRKPRHSTRQVYDTPEKTEEIKDPATNDRFDKSEFPPKKEESNE